MMTTIMTSGNSKFTFSSIFSSSRNPSSNLLTCRILESTYSKEQSGNGKALVEVTLRNTLIDDDM